MHALRFPSIAFFLSAAATFSICGQAGAQQQPAPVAPPTVIQLPTFHSFSVSTTVLVPDRGGTYLGGVGRAAGGSLQSGIPGLGGRPFTNTASSGVSGASGLWIGAQIHDLQAMDEFLLGQTAAGAASPANSVAAAGSQSGSTDSVAAIHAQAASQDAAREQEAAGYLKRAREVLAEGKPGLAKIYFRMAATRSTGQTRDESLAGLQSVSTASSPVLTAK